MALIDSIRKYVLGTGVNSFFMNWGSQPGQMNKEQILGLYQGIVHTCISAIAQAVAKIEFEAYQELPDGTLKEVPNHRFLDVLARPNPNQSKFRFIELLVTYLLATGEVYLYAVNGEATGQPKQYYILPPNRVTPAIDKDAEVPTLLGYVLNKSLGEQVPLDLEEVVPILLPNPADPWCGLGIVEAGLTGILTDKYGAEFTRNYIFNNAMPPGIVNVKSKMDKDAFEKLKSQWQQNYGSIANAGKTAFLNGAEAEFIQVGGGLGDVALKELRQMTRDDIMTMFRVPKSVLGITDDVNRANAEASMYQFMSNVVDPAMYRIVDALQSEMAKFNRSSALSKTTFVLDYESPIPEDIVQRDATLSAGVNKWLTYDEARAEVGLDPLPNGAGEIMYQPINMVPVGEPAAPADNTNKAAAGKAVIRFKTTKRLAAPADPLKPARIKFIAARKDLDFTTEQKENFRLHLQRNAEAYEKSFNRKIQPVLRKQQAEVLENIRTHTTKAYEEYTFDYDKANQEVKTVLEPLMVELISEQGKIALDFAGSDATFEMSEVVRRTISASIERMATGFNDETRAALEKVIGDGIKEGKTFEQIAKDVEGVYSQAKGYRAERIARTETQKASNYATNEAYRQTGYVVKKEWYTNPGACEFCLSMKGKIVGLDTVFKGQGDHVEGVDENGNPTGNKYVTDYEDVEAPPLHPQCRCTIVPVRE